MSDLFQQRRLLCPYVRARDYLEGMLAPAAESKVPQRLELRVRFAGMHGRGLRKDVLVTYDVGNGPVRFEQFWRVHWTPYNGGLYPEFDGVLAVRAEGTRERSMLELRGHYQPPLGIAGAAFDAMLGSRIASLTARELLDRLGQEMETRYRAEEVAEQANAR